MKYLQERGIDTAVAQFIPEYAAHKEQQVRLLLSFALLSLGSFSSSLLVGVCKVAG